MATNEIETYIFGKDCAHFLNAFHLSDLRISLAFSPMEPGTGCLPEDVIATFMNPTMEYVEQDGTEPVEWPLDVIGFDSHRCGDHWRFVLNCGTVEWSWTSEWPNVKRIQPAE
jgi:hypothetical protein